MDSENDQREDQPAERGLGDLEMPTGQAPHYRPAEVATGENAAGKDDFPDGWAVPDRPRRGGRRAGARVLLALLSVVVLSTTGYAYIAKDRLQKNVRTTDMLTQPGEVAPPADDGALDILLVGSDARTDTQGNPLPAGMLKALRTEEKPGINTDTIILLRFPKDGGRPTGISIPRDTWVNVPGRGKAKINSAYGVAKADSANELRRAGATDQTEIERDSDQAGRKVLVQTVQDLTQLRIDHYAEVNLLGFYLLTEALGGVRVCLNHATEDKDSGSDFRAGPQTVSGGGALSFVRQRKNLPRGDLDRIVRQQAFLSSALRQVVSAETLAHPSTLDNLIDAARRSIVLDPGFDLLDFADQIKKVASGDMSFVTIPVVNVNGRSEDGTQSIVEVDPVAVQQFVAGLAGRGPPAAPPAAGSGSGGGGISPRAMATADVACVN